MGCWHWIYSIWERPHNFSPVCWLEGVSTPTFEGVTWSLGREGQERCVCVYISLKLYIQLISFITWMWCGLLRGWFWFHTFPCAVKNCASNGQQSGKYYEHNCYDHPGHICCLNCSLLCSGWDRCLCSWTLYIWKEYKKNLHDWMHLAFRYILR